jgi:hypothetical protein
VLSMGFKMTGICNCVCGPPRGGQCSACGAYGEPIIPHGPAPQPIFIWPQFYPKQLTEEDLRRIIREEIKRSK